ncbi:polyphenol oxidase family protein [Arthrobacter oryzae]|uniref:polyphenol oxidase family protein n=1 Tax=Arthrobacter oryzae TaxID=409290 RepID=UPI0027D92578|nr:polyphenol oxidase family protein [Arthrobacter oryzae]
MFWWRTEVRPGVWVAFTDAGAGNLALHVGDDPADVRRRRELLEAEVGLAAGSFQYMNQVHGNAVAYIGDATDSTAADSIAAGSPTAGGPTADAMVSAGRPLAVMVADCVPVVLAGATSGGQPVLGVAHAGRPGVASGVIPATLARMRAEGAEDIRAWIGPSICGSCYEVPEGMRADVAAAVPATWATTSWGTPGLDLPAGARSQLEANGVTVEYSGPCTLENEDLFSYRGNPDTGRFAGLVWTDE